MIHKFISNDNQGNVNTLEIGSDYTKISKVVDPVNDDDAVNKKYVDQTKKFIVTLTPTLPDYSGTMDKTPQEITAAYEAGQDIEFDIPSLEVKCKAMEFAVNDGIVQAGAIVTYRVGGSHLLIEVLTHSTASEYFTSIYSLTPAS